VSSPTNGNAFKKNGRIVIIGASLAGLRGAEALRNEGFSGHLTIIGDEPHEPYDRPPLSKQVQKGWVKADHTKLPRMRKVDAEWRLGVAATGLDRASGVVRLANGDEVAGDALLIATGVRARPWPNPEEAKLEGVYTLRTCEDAARLQAALAARPRRVLVIGAGFIGSEVASVCRELGLEVTVAERAAAPLAGALGNVIGAIAAEMQRDAGVDLAPVSASRSLKETQRGMCVTHAFPTGPCSMWTWCWHRWARSATSNGWRAPGWLPASGVWPVMPVAAPSISMVS